MAAVGLAKRERLSERPRSTRWIGAGPGPAYSCDPRSALGNGRRAIRDVRLDLQSDKAGIQYVVPCGRLRLRGGFIDGDARWLVQPRVRPIVDAALHGPLAIMLSADRVPVKSPHSRDAVAQVDYPDRRINRYSHYLAIALPTGWRGEHPS